MDILLIRKKIKETKKKVQFLDAEKKKKKVSRS